MSNPHNPLCRALYTEPPAHLFASVMSTVERERGRAARFRFRLLVCISLISVSALVPATIYTMQLLVSSGFFDYASLLYSDGDIAFAYAGDFALGVLETLPIFSLALMFIFLFTTLWTMRFAASELQRARLSIRFT